MRAGLALTLDYAYRQLRLHWLEANIQPANVTSIALVERLSFQREGYARRHLKRGGRWRDHQRWAYSRRRLARRPPECPVTFGAPAA